MLKKVLIANRGEIAVRIIRACREMGISTVAVYSEIDKEALHTQLADEAVCIGSAMPKDSYLNITNILSACVLTGADAIHPGFGFLSENPKFAKMCRQCNIKFIGPDYETIELMGNKAKAREIMKASGVPVVPGYEGEIRDEAHALEIAKGIGYPIMIKASAGGGGKGIRVAHNDEEFLMGFKTAKTEAKACFGDDSLYIEKFVQKPKHIEFQILADEHGHVIHLCERECSMQRKNQKVLEEAPSNVLTEELRAKMGEIAKKAALAVDYKNAGTIEFLFDRDNNFYFMEMNTRIQVEHPITEMITGIDLVKEQLKIASGEKLAYTQDDIKIKGHAIECRVNAEDPEHDFRPCPGTIEELCVPGGMGVRVDSAIFCGYKIPHCYDSMIAKLITFGDNRNEAIVKMDRALAEFAVGGVKTNIDFELSILHTKEFLEGDYDTSFLAEKMVKKNA
ncbi:acetyl-CoA carboxylase biotin carboxylase subunit [Clostridium beijerinckii]|jgi:acetyl-CoA carboxylase, biotin carboxylase|uniref:Biotin carboxylase n=2 Tax=Clostridium beijerinckii TaxID=1520 RepID=A0A1B9BQ10_CLOBE|nr:acetyl-CoA carboxylase biotin carboxylase subunit [Clostridium beijerinckii]ABR33259.1 acetyl-CoA carboxylase, biotin carboxylase [Clostridium beijerinckii NCIMB 8052]AIU04113.1 biotin carboxylase [Clostridium beijerinckii ATCC 35702]ALB47641.1 acetyl-CoA carboxylase subunit C [Clostridium beijerinckii NRRL B-598]MBF7811842.1 acetyl-CoA carboxylase biotin carboxylase subunit [Clostridium beijerinckii]NOW92927.1 acetyl-CoA carboxylase biotin carboxylase subunit [Clostridium beijerinckii]